jgi:hypothetical protein
LEENVVPGALLAQAPLLGQQTNAFTEWSVKPTEIVAASSAVLRIAIVAKSVLYCITSYDAIVLFVFLTPALN